MFEQMTSGKLLSVIVPSYNMEVYLAKNISSMMVQDEALRQLVEVIVVNDGSKERTSEIAHAFAEKYLGCVTVIDKPNGHYGSYINAALLVVKGKYIRILDADDYAKPEAFERFLAYLAKAVVIVGWGMRSRPHHRAAISCCPHGVAGENLHMHGTP